MRRSMGALVVLGLVAGTIAHADDKRTSFVVTASVAARAALQVVEEPALIQISAQDIDRGYKEVSARYVVDSNSDRGWLLRLAPRLGVARRVEVRGLRSPVVVEGEPVEVYRTRTPDPERLTLTYRLVLEPGIQPGRCELPIHVSAVPR